MPIHPSYFAQFTPERGGAIHEQFVRRVVVVGIYRVGLCGATPVYSLTGADFWYRPDEFVAMLRGAASPVYRDLADRLSADAS